MILLRLWLVKRRNLLRRMKFIRTIGKGSYVDRTAQFLGMRHVRIDSNTFVGERVVINTNDTTKSDQIRVHIDANVFVGRDCFISSGKSVRISPYCLITDGCRLLSAGHIVDNPLVPYGESGVAREYSILIGTNCWLGSDVIVVGNVAVGYGSVIGAGSVVVREIPPFSVAVGSPARVIKRFSFRKCAWIPAGEVTDESELDHPLESIYLEQLRTMYPAIGALYFAASSKFGST